MDVKEELFHESPEKVLGEPRANGMSFVELLDGIRDVAHRYEDRADDKPDGPLLKPETLEWIDAVVQKSIEESDEETDGNLQWGADDVRFVQARLGIIARHLEEHLPEEAPEQTWVDMSRFGFETHDGRLEWEPVDLHGGSAPDRFEITDTDTRERYDVPLDVDLDDFQNNYDDEGE